MFAVMEVFYKFFSVSFFLHQIKIGTIFEFTASFFFVIMSTSNLATNVDLLNDVVNIVHTMERYDDDVKEHHLIPTRIQMMQKFIESMQLIELSNFEKIKINSLDSAT